MGKQWVTLFVGGLGGLVLMAVACAPASEAKAPAPAAEQPAAEKPAAEKPATEKPAAEKPKVPTSVSGIPLDANAKRGGVLKASYTQEGPTFSPWEETIGTAFYAGQPVSNMLIQTRTWGTEQDFKNKAYFELHPDLATSWEQSADGLKWTFRLRDGVKFEDGVPFTCEDAKWTLDSIRTGKGLKRSPRGTHFRVIKSVECADKLTVVVNLNWPSPALLEKIGMPYNMVLPKHLYENDTDSLRQKPPKGTGPFTVKEWLPGEKIILVRKPDYWDQPFPYLDGIEYTFMSTPAVPTALRAGRIDFGASHGYESAQAKGLIAECKTCKVYDKVTGVSFRTLYVNQQRPPWNLPLVKEALAYALDRKRFIQVSVLGSAVPPTGGGLYPDSFWAMPPERVKTIPGFNFDDPEGNKKKARELLAKAGYKPGDLTMPLRIWATIQADIPVIVEDLESVGIKVEAKPLETAEFFRVMGSGDFEVGQHSFWMGGTDPDMTLYEIFYTGSDRNYGRYSNPEVDRLIDKQSATLDREERQKIAWDAIELAMRDGAQHLLAHMAYQPIVSERMQGFLPAPNYLAGYGAMIRFQNIWLAEK